MRRGNRSAKQVSVWISAALLLAVLLLAVPMFGLPVQASSHFDARISRLESENTFLRSRVSRLETQLLRLTNRSGINYPDPIPEGASTPARPSTDSMFDRLATLAIEQRQRLDELETRLEALEAQVSS